MKRSRIDESSDKETVFRKFEATRRGFLSNRSSRNRIVEGEIPVSFRQPRKRYVHDSDKRKLGNGYAFREWHGNERVVRRSESFSTLKRESSVGFQSERERSAREESVSSWRRCFGGKVTDGMRWENERSVSRCNRRSKAVGDTRLTKGDEGRSRSDGNGPLRSGNGEFEQFAPNFSGGIKDDEKRSSSRDLDGSEEARSGSRTWPSPSCSKGSHSEPSQSLERETMGGVMRDASLSNDEMEEGELVPDTEFSPSVGGDENGDDAGEEENAELNTCSQKVEDEPHSSSSRLSVGLLVENATFSKGDEHEGNKDAPSCNMDMNRSFGEGTNDKEGEGEAKQPHVIDDHVLQSAQCGNDPNITPFNLEEEIQDTQGVHEVKETEPNSQDQNIVAATVHEHLGCELVSVGENLGENVHDSSTCHINNKDETGGRNPNTTYEQEEQHDAISLFAVSSAMVGEKEVRSGIIKEEDNKSIMDSLDLSLRLPNVLLPIQAQDSSSHMRSVHSFNSFGTDSEGRTASLSFSDSLSFFHNPSCSLTQNSTDVDAFEQSVHSRPLFHRIDQRNLLGEVQNGEYTARTAQTDPIADSIDPVHQTPSQPCPANASPFLGSAMPGGSQKKPNVHDQLSLQPKSGSSDRSLTQCDARRHNFCELNGKKMTRNNCRNEREQHQPNGTYHMEMVNKIVSDPISVITIKSDEMTEQTLSFLKENIHKIFFDRAKQAQLSEIQRSLENRSDLSLEQLLKCSMVQLQFLVALKTGLQEFIRAANNLSVSDLAEIFLNLRCRNINCRSSLPVEECDCRSCGKRNGFCSACMCLVCSKFDMAANTCTWVGCDVCLHWCHVDCALKGGYIRSGQSPNGEMHFHCVSCDHPSEMFGFVKEVFQNFAKDWQVSAFCRELECVKGIFAASKDARGMRLCDTANQVLEKMANGWDLSDACNHILNALLECESSKAPPPSIPVGDEPRGTGISSDKPICAEDLMLYPIRSEKPLPVINPDALIPSFHMEPEERRVPDPLPPKNLQRAPVFDELESIVRMKLAEAKMFQTRADDARREAEGLKRIAKAKDEKIEEDYVSRITKLRLIDAEETRKGRFEECQALERAYWEYYSIKMRMEADVKDLLLKMEATRRSIAS